eukprot:m.198449 g.198449  ORF g.198449 m.198449 type:complete len:99 (+) comp39560_c0_seq3:23-319(+)
MADDDNSVDRSEGTTPRASSRMTLKDATSKVKQEALRSLQLGDRTETETPSENPEEPMKEKESNDEEPPPTTNGRVPRKISLPSGVNIHGITHASPPK